MAILLPSVGTSTRAPSAASAKVTGTSISRSSPRRLKIGLGVTLLKCARDHIQISNDRLGRLISVAWILAKQSLNHFIQHSGHGQPQPPQAWRFDGQVLSQDFTNVFAVKRGFSNQTLEQQDAGGVQVRTCRDFLIQQTGAFG